MNLRFLIFILILIGCDRCPEKVPPFTYQEFNGRDEIISYNQMVRRPVYQAKTPLSWKRIDPPLDQSILDITIPIVTFKIDNEVVLTVHNFPTNCLEEQIPVANQAERCLSQFKSEEHQIKSVIYERFSGLFFEGKSDQVTLYAWTLQLNLEHYQTLYFLGGTVEEEEHYKQMRADLIIKAQGPTDLIEKHREEIFLFANSFELIQEIPQR